MDIEWRGITRADVPAWNRLLATAELVDQTGEHYDEADLHEELSDPAAGPDDRISGWLGDEMVAFAGVRPRGSVTDHWRIDGEGTVDPAHRGNGLGTEGLSWAVGRLEALRKERHPDFETRLQFLGHLDLDDQVRLFEGAGFTAVNWSAVMRAHFDGGDVMQPGDVSWPAGHHLETYDRSRSAATMAAHNVAFQDHWGFVSWSPAMWEQWVDGTKNSRHDLSWVLVPDDDPDRVVAYLLTSEFAAYEAATGRRDAYLAKIGVRPGLRGRGVASSLLQLALRRYREDGFHETSLDVDTSNPTGAFGLYERAGYRVERRTAIFQRVWPAFS
jgi:ribosomal protein S18 acetylase RimI-like enzyme